jgi:hypothetical protein
MRFLCIHFTRLDTAVCTYTTPKRRCVQFLISSLLLFHTRHITQIASPPPPFQGVVSDFDARTDGVSASCGWEDLSWRLAIVVAKVDS